MQSWIILIVATLLLVAVLYPLIKCPAPVSFALGIAALFAWRYLVERRHGQHDR